MPKANNETTTLPPLMSGAAALALMEANNKIGGDTELIALCHEFHRLTAEMDALPHNNSDEVEERCQQIIDATRKLLEKIDGFPVASVGDLALKAAIVKKHLRPDESYYADTALSLADDCIALDASPQTHPDAELIAMAERIIDLERRARSLHPNFCNCIEDDDRRAEAIEDITTEQDGIVDQIEKLGVRSVAGAAALVRAAMLWWPVLLQEIEDNGGLDARLLKPAFELLAPDAVEEQRQMKIHLNRPTLQDIAWAETGGAA